MHEGEWSLRLGLPGWPRIGEEVIVTRNIPLAELCDSPIHCQHISSGGSVRLLRDAKARGVKISGEVCPHHIASDRQMPSQTFDSNYKMNPPLRTERDIDAISRGSVRTARSTFLQRPRPACAFTRRRSSSIRRRSESLASRPSSRSSATSSCTRGAVARFAPPDRDVHRRIPRVCLSLDRRNIFRLVLRRTSRSIDPDLEWTFDREKSRSTSPKHTVPWRQTQGPCGHERL